MARIVVHEVGPRDGLQMEKQVVPLGVKEGWIRRVMEAGVDIVQVGSFVHPEKVPQKATPRTIHSSKAASIGQIAIHSTLNWNKSRKARDRASNTGVMCIPLQDINFFGCVTVLRLFRRLVAARLWLC